MMRLPRFGCSMRLRSSGFSPAVILLPVLSFLSPGTADGLTGPVRTEFDGSRHEVRCTVVFPEESLHVGESGGFSTVTLPGCGHVEEAGSPALPVLTLRIALPHGMKATHVRALPAGVVEIAGNQTILPAQPPRPILSSPEALRFIDPDPGIYQSREDFPSQWAVLMGQTDLAGQSIAHVRVHPLRYSPLEGRLRLATSLEIVVEGTTGYVCGDYLPAAAAARVRKEYERALAAMVVNPDDIVLGVSGASAPRGVGPGAYEYVIITSSDWMDDLQPLADWRTKQGIRTRIVSTQWILLEGGYAGYDLEKLRAFVIDAHDNWATGVFLLAADTNIIPYHTRRITVPGYGTLDIPNDTYYADFDDDWMCEVTVARLSIRTAGQAGAFIDKIMTYEKHPPTTGWATTAAFFGFDIGECGDGYGENHKENYVRALHVPGAWTVDTEYDSEPGSHRSGVLNDLAQGHHLVNHNGHCSSDRMDTGWICHSELLYTSDVSALTNGDRQSIAFATGCYPSLFPTYACIAEAFVLNPNGGGVAFIGNSSLGWGGDLVNPDAYSLRQDRFFYRNLFDDGVVRLGDNFTDLKNDAFDLHDPYNLHKFVFTQLHLLGEPMIPVWTEDPRQLAVIHGTTLPSGEYTAFPVSVDDEHGAPAAGATVCVYKEGDIYEVATTDESGMVTFELTPASEGNLHVTVSRRNHLPYEGEAVVQADPSAIAGEVNELPVALDIAGILPTPFRRITGIRITVPQYASAGQVRLEIFDCQGRRVRGLVDGEVPPGIHSYAWDGEDEQGMKVASGVYFCRLRSHGEVRNRVLVVQK